MISNKFNGAYRDSNSLETFTVTDLSLLNKWHFNLHLNMSSEDEVLIATGCSFQRTGAAWENARSP